MTSPDTASAARRVADLTRQGCSSVMPDLVALLPILDAVAAMPEPDEARVERWAKVIAVAADSRLGYDNWPEWKEEARAAIALADAERVAEGCNDIERRSAEIQASADDRRRKFREANRGPTKLFKL